ncbi:MAG: helix-turn-helix domain-containing protein [Lachnospiraceae bacterium]|nr:helix-turn-helix domain-containing protein [Lachnospiraceae bacterium]
MEKFGLLICDDEWMIREQILRSAREMEGFQIYTAESGRAAQNVLGKFSIDGVILDVRMPEMDGIALLQWMQKMGKEPVVVILSGHDEFDYAQQCLRYGAVEYLLKPVTDDQIQIFLAELQERIRRKQIYIRKIEEYSQRLDSLKPVLREQFFRELLQRSLSREAVQRMEEFLEVHILYPCLLVAVIQIEMGGEGGKDSREPLQRYALGEVLESQLKERIPVNLFHADSKLLVIMAGGTREDMDNELMGALGEILHTMSRDLSLQFHIGVGGVVHTAEKIRDSYAQALYALSFNDFEQEQGIVDIRDVADGDKQGDGVQKLRSTLGELLTAAALMSRQELTERLQSALEAIRGTELDLDMAIYFCSYLAVIALERLDMQMEWLRRNPIYEISAKTTLEEVYHSTQQLLVSVEQALTEKKQNRIRRIAKTCQKIIERDYGKKIGILEIADQMEVSSNYLSTIFRRETRYSVNEYLNAVRLEHAKRLLRDTNLKVYEIAEQVGFSDTYYFSTVFKKHIGVSPSEYRNSLG